MHRKCMYGSLRASGIDRLIRVWTSAFQVNPSFRQRHYFKAQRVPIKCSRKRLLIIQYPSILKLGSWNERISSKQQPASTAEMPNIQKDALSGTPRIIQPYVSIGWLAHCPHKHYIWWDRISRSRSTCWPTLGLMNCVEAKHFSRHQELVYLLETLDEVRCKWG